MGLALLALAACGAWWAWPRDDLHVAVGSAQAPALTNAALGAAMLEGAFRSPSPETPELPSEPPHRAVDVEPGTTARLVTVRGRVLDEYDTPRGDVTVRVQHVKPLTHRSRGWSATLVAELLSGDDGSFEVTVESGITVRLTADASDILSPSLPLEMSAEEKSVILRVQRTPNIGGRVFDERGEPHALARVHLRWDQLWGRHETRCDPQGRFEAAIPPGAKRLTVSTGILECRSRRIGAPLGDRMFDVPVGTMDLELHSHEPVALRGRLVGPEGEHIVRGRVRAWRVGQGPRRASALSHLTGNTGEFIFGDMRPGTWALRANPEVPGHAESEVMTVEAPDVDLRIQCPATPGIHGRVEGRDLGGFKVWWHDPGRSIGPTTGEVEVLADGSFRIPSARIAPHRLYVYGRGDMRMADLRGVLPSKRPMRIRLQPGLSIRGAFAEGERDEWRLVVAVQGKLDIRARADQSGAFEITGLSAGGWHIYPTLVIGRRQTRRPPGVAAEAGSRGVMLPR